MTDTADKIKAVLQDSGLKGRDLKSVLREVVEQNWPDMPSWSKPLTAPLIEETRKASVGSGAALVFEENGVYKIVLAVAGDHYRKPKDAVMPHLYTVPGGFITLTHSEGSTFVPLSSGPENPATGAAREIEEEFPNADGSPLIAVDPKRLKLLESRTLGLSDGSVIAVNGSMLQLNAAEVRVVKEHVARLANDPAYKADVALKTVNPDLKLPEVSSVEILNLDDVVQGKYPLLHQDQETLFAAAARELKSVSRTGPTRAYKAKVKTLDELTALAGAWRAQGATDIGVTSGVFDIVHPGHISFCEDANRLCSRLVVIIASDRTVREQKGAEKPYITEMKRAQTIAALDTVDAVIISDELYHETILAALQPEIMFKGDDYKGKTIIGAEMVGKVVLIPCAEKEFYSSSAFVKKIQAGAPPAITPR